MPCFVQVLVIITSSSAITLGRNHCRLALLLEPLNYTFIGIVSLVSKECIGSKFIKQNISSIQVTGRVQESDENL
jgi:hypothetical protein